MRKVIKINGVDFTNFFTPVGYKVLHPKVRGNNSGTMQDGTEVDDVIRVKVTITANLMPLTEEQVAKILNALDETYVDIYFFDPWENAYRQLVFMTPPSPEVQYKGVGINGSGYWTASSVTFIER